MLIWLRPRHAATVGGRRLFPLFLTIFLVTTLILGGCARTERGKSEVPKPANLTVAAAADLQAAFAEMGEIFARQTGAKATFSFGSSGVLTQQIENGAPIDVFAAADQSYIEALRKKGLVWPDTVTLYARGRLVLATAPNSPVSLNRLEDLLSPAVKKIALANPEHAPYGKAAREALQKAGVWEKVQGKLVYGNNIRDTQTLVETGNAEAGLLALSLVKNSNLKYFLVDQALFQPLDQAMAVVKGTKNEELARKFLQLVLSPEGQAVLEKYGFEKPGR